MKAESEEQKRVRLAAKAFLASARAGEVVFDASDAKVAERYGITASTVSHARRQLKIPAQGRKLKRVQWSKVDWSLSDNMLKTRLKVSRERVAAARSKYAPETEAHARPGATWAAGKKFRTDAESCSGIGCDLRSICARYDEQSTARRPEFNSLAGTCAALVNKTLRGVGDLPEIDHEEPNGALLVASWEARK